ncbi:MAG: radical SAM protein [Bacteroidota bacterium]
MSSTEKERLKILVYKPKLAIQTIKLNRFIRCEPLELEYLYTVLQHHDVYLLDGIVDRRNPVRLASKLKSQIVLFTSLITTVSDVLSTASRLKNLPDPPKIFVGGPHAEVVPGDFFSKDIDGVFFANQLDGIVNVLDRIIQEKPYSDVRGAAFPVNGKFILNPSPPLDPAKLPRVRHFLLEQSPSRYRIIYYKPCAAIKTSYGCTGSCTFCFCAQMHGGTYGARPIKDVIDEIEDLPVKSIFVLDDNFLHDRKRLLDFCELITKRKLEKEFIIIGNAEFVSRNPDVMKSLREAGVKALMVGFEFVTNTELQAINKKATLNDNKQTIEICRDLDIDLFALFIINPAWQHADFRRLARYLRDHYIPFALFSTLTVFPGTKMASLQPDSPGIKTKGWRYDLLRLHQKPAHMSKLHFYLWLFYLYMIPGKRFATLQKYRQRYGVFGIISHSLTSFYTGLEYLIKLLIWK